MNAVTNVPVEGIRRTNIWSDTKAQYEEHSWKEFRVVCRMALNAPVGAEYLPTFVEQAGKQVWHFDKNGPATMVFLREYGDEPVLALTTKREVLDALFLCDLGKRATVRLKGGKEVTLPARPITEIALCKQALAEDLERQAVFTAFEQQALDEMNAEERAKSEAAAQAKREAEEKKRRDEHEARVLAQAAKLGKILARKKITAYTKVGNNFRRGIPVTGNEWEALADNTNCISVESFDDKTGVHGAVIECFRVAKTGARVKRHNVEVVHLLDPDVATPSGCSSADALEAEDIGKFLIGGKMVMMPVYADIKPSLIPFQQPFAVRVGTTTTIYHRENGGVLKSLGIVRQQPATA